MQKLPVDFGQYENYQQKYENYSAVLKLVFMLKTSVARAFFHPALAPDFRHIPVLCTVLARKKFQLHEQSQEKS